MQAVILAAGKGTRMLPLTENRPKPLLKIANKTILEHNLEQLEGLIDEAIIVVNYKKEMIKELIGDCYKKIKIKYIEQKETLGTGNALETASELLEDKFLVLCGDDLYFKEDLQKVVLKNQCILLKESETPENFGVVLIEDGFVAGLEEKPQNPKNNLVNTGLYLLNKDIFKIKLNKTERGEFELTDYIKEISGLEFVIADNWFPITHPWNLLKANEFILRNIEKKIEGVVEDNCHIGENAQIGEGSVVKSGAYIENNVIIGKNCKIGPNCYIRGSTSIGDGCHVGNGVEIKNSIFFEKSNAPHLNYIGDSIIGSNTNLGGGTIVANLRHDNKNILVNIKDKLVDTKRRKFGAIVGDVVKTGAGTLIYPGRKIMGGCFTKPKEIVTKDVSECKL
ncbi:MAG: NTP transferase domain-containing protein [Candidatus Aenigmarchaeota archaeon]|nr:NTP transferase domain-containing protein [Candidatus Aenigmarchaeota archaeon]